MTQKIIKLSYESLNDQRLTGLGCDLYIVSSNGIGFPAHASVVCSQSDVFQVSISFGYRIMISGRDRGRDQILFSKRKIARSKHF